MEQTIQEQWTQIQEEHPPITEPHLIVSFFQRKLSLLLQFKKIGVNQISGERLTVEQSIEEFTEILRILGRAK